MPPNPATPTKAEKSDDRMDKDFKFVWAIVCQLAQQGKLSGINWAEVGKDVGAPTPGAATKRWHDTKQRLEKRGFEKLPAAGPTAKLETLRKPKSKREEGDEGKEQTPKKAKATPKKKTKKEQEATEGEDNGAEDAKAYFSSDADIGSDGE